jgi:hypothetical protein
MGKIIVTKAINGKISRLMALPTRPERLKLEFSPLELANNRLKRSHLPPRTKPN